MTSWTDGRVAIGGSSQQDTFTDRELVGFAVTTADPACGSVVTTQPTTLLLTCLMRSMKAPSILPTSRLMESPRTRTRSANGDLTITFHFDSTPVVNQGEQTMHIPQDAFTRQSDNQGVFEFNCTFRYDETLLSVTDTVPPVGGTFDPPGPVLTLYV